MLAAMAAPMMGILPMKRPAAPGPPPIPPPPIAGLCPATLESLRATFAESAQDGRPIILGQGAVIEPAPMTIDCDYCGRRAPLGVDGLCCGCGAPPSGGGR